MQQQRPINYIYAHMSMAHTFGNVAAYITNYVKNIFPVDYFNTINITSTIANRYFNIYAAKNKEFIKKRKPMLIVRPRLEIDDSDNFLYGTLMTKRIADNFTDLDFGNLQNFYGDADQGLMMKYLLNRKRISFDITIMVEQYMEQIDKVEFLKNQLQWELPFKRPMFLESLIHSDLIYTISDQVGLDRNDPGKIVKYMNQHSEYPVTYKLKNSTGTDEYFRYYPTNMEMTISGLAVDDGQSRGMSTESYAINFTITTEFNTAGLYYLFSRDFKRIEQAHIDIRTNSSIVPVFTMPDYENIIPRPEGWELYEAPMFTVNSNTLPDELQLGDDQGLNRTIVEVIKYHTDRDLDVFNVLKMFILKDDLVLDASKGDFSFDPSTLKLTINKVSKASTYRLLIYINVLYINELIADILKISEEK